MAQPIQQKFKKKGKIVHQLHPSIKSKKSELPKQTNKTWKASAVTSTHNTTHKETSNTILLDGILRPHGALPWIYILKWNNPHTWCSKIGMNKTKHKPMKVTTYSEAIGGKSLNHSDDAPGHRSPENSLKNTVSQTLPRSICLEPTPTDH